MKFNERNIAITDLETSGDVFGLHEILEIGLVVVNPKTLQIIDTLNVKIKPEYIENAVPAALERNGYKKENWGDAISLKEGMELYASKTKDAVFYAYNVSFDWGFMSEAFKKTGVKNSMDYHRLDLMSMAYIKYKDQLTGMSLDSVSNLIGLPKEPMPHNALNGAMQAYYLLKNFYLDDLSLKFQTYLKDPVFLEILDIVKQNSKGKIWIIGGFVYKNLARILSNDKEKVYNYDIDFIVEERNENLKNIPGWRIEMNNYNNENYVRNKNKMSFTDIHKAVRISGIQNPTIEKFIKGTPLNIQSMAYDLDENKIIGKKGIEALITKTVKINNSQQADSYAKMKGKEIEDILKEKKRELGFDE